MTKPVTLRCAIYTRKSSEEGLEQDFNSLHAQREACEAYVRSQAGEGWTALAAQYDDGGYSGGSMDRPGLKQLLADIQARRVDVVVVYKVDRLTRSLTDFAKIVETFDAAGASFVSVTQAFNTTTSMGRLTLNVLLSFAQFEREVTGERIRDKIAASKAKGLWMGGGLALGYDADGRTLKINEAEAATVRHMFTRYLELRSVHALRSELEAQGYKSKFTRAKNGNERGGVSMNRGALFYMLSNRLYRGEVPHKGAWHAGQHPAIIDGETFDAVQAKLLLNAGPKRRAGAGLDPLAPSAPLAGMIFAGSEDRMSPVSQRGRSGAIYRYYVVTGTLTGRHAGGPCVRAPAAAVEALVLDQLRRHGLLVASDRDAAWKAARKVLERVEIDGRQIRISVRSDAWTARRDAGRAFEDHAFGDDRVVEDADRVVIICEAAIRRRGGETRIVRASGEMADNDERPDVTLLKALARAESWKRELVSGQFRTVGEVAANASVRREYTMRILRLAFLAPDIKRAVIDGRPPAGLTLQRIVEADLPDSWEQQRRLLRVASR